MAATILLLSLLAAANEPTPTADYVPRRVRGFTVLVHPQVLKHEKEAVEAGAEIERQLRQIERVVPPARLAPLRKVRFWLEWEDPKKGACQFHVSAAWLEEHGINPEKAGDVEISDARNFVRWSQQDQPWMLWHELAHAYHFRVLGEDHAGIAAAYRQAAERKLYDNVRHVRGAQGRAYALTNNKEYFAELSEAYFGRNDFFPFDRAELEKHDPAGFRLMQTIWDVPTR